MSDDLFEKIIDREIPADILYEDQRVIAFRDISPQAPTHVLIVPKKRIPTLNDLDEMDRELVGHMVWVGQCIAEEEGVSDTGYRMVFNCNREGGQTVYHIHLHLIGGRTMAWPPG